MGNAAIREDTYDAHQRGEHTSRQETRLDAEAQAEKDGDEEK
jgi:hypothetical protein